MENAVDTGLFHTVGINFWVTAKEASAATVALNFATTKAYESELLPKYKTEIKQLINLTNQNERIALVCFEADHHLCHRHTLIDHLQKDKAFQRHVIHL